jgi:hypothetical protein
MVYYKLILNERRLKEDQIYPVIVHVIHNLKNSSLATGHSGCRTGVANNVITPAIKAGSDL